MNEMEKKKKILIIDDEKSIRFIVENTFKKEFEVVSISDGKAALEYLNSGNLPDLIICDIQMPEIDGFELIKKVRASGFFEDIPLIMLSGNEESKDRIKCFDLGADDYIIKPFNPAELLARVRRRMNAREAYLKRGGI